MKGLDLGERVLPGLGVLDGLGGLQPLLAGADGLGERVLVEFGGLGLPPARGDVFGDDHDGLDAPFRDGERRGRRTEGLEADLMKRMGEKPAFHVDAVLGRVPSSLELLDDGLYALDERFVVGDRGVERTDQFNEIGLALDDVREEVGVVCGEGADLIEQGLPRFEFARERNAGIAVHEASSRYAPVMGKLPSSGCWRSFDLPGWIFTASRMAALVSLLSCVPISDA